MAGLLIAEAILIAAIRALPGDAVAGHAPYVFVHTGLTNFKSATALPAKDEFLPATMALVDGMAFAAIFSVGVA